MSSIDRLNHLNEIEQTPSPTGATDAQDLLSIPPYSDLAAQLDLWTNVSFASDEPFGGHNEGEDGTDKKGSDSDKEEIKRKRQQLGGPKIIHDNIPTQSHAPQQVTQQSNAAPPFDLQSFLTLAGMAAAPMPLDTLSLNHLLSLAPYQSQFPPLVPGLPATSVTHSSVSGVTASNLLSQPSSSSEPPAKRARTRKSSVGNSTAGTALSATSTSTQPQALAPAPPPRAAPSVAPSDADHEDDDLQGDGLTPSEDKRRRNTQASARFRLKKKEREAAMEQKCKELESKVGELERECEALRRENGWLKGLVVGVTGGTGSMNLSGPPTMSRPPAATPVSGGEKRKRDGVDRQ